MLKNFVLTIVSEDKPGVVEHLANAISGNQASWLESSFSQLAGKFAGVVRVQVDEGDKNPLIASLEKLAGHGIHVQIEVCSDTTSATTLLQHAKFTALGPDRKGIVREFSQAFAGYGINIDDLETRLSSMPYSGEPLFEAKGNLSIPDGVDLDDLEDKLLKIADQLGLDFSLHRNEE